MLNFLRLRRADRESQHERTDLRTDLDETSALVLKSHAAAAPQAHKALVRAKKFREISPDSRRNLREINERNIPSLGTKSAPPPIPLHWLGSSNHKRRRRFRNVTDVAPRRLCMLLSRPFLQEYSVACTV